MASFFENLWNSVFTPGPTPTLLVATNATFAALQLLFFTLLIATYSIHFFILSGLTAGLWWSINWFAAEIRAAQAKEEEAKRIRDARREKERDKGGSEGEAMDTGDDTEVETEVEEKHRPKPRSEARPSRRAEAAQSTVFVEREPPQQQPGGSAPVQPSTPAGASSATGSSNRLAPMAGEGLKMRRSMGESTGELSTDSEWERVSEDSGER
jgi:hypothetical protein